MTAPLPPAWHELPNAPPPGTVLGWLEHIGDGEAQMHTVYSPSDAAQARPFGVLLLRSGTQVKAFANRCAHFGVPLATRQNLLKYQPHISISCNVHYARYRWADGVCDRGDCEGESLIAIPVAQDAAGCIRIA